MEEEDDEWIITILDPLKTDSSPATTLTIDSLSLHSSLASREDGEPR
jgi:hypothetical protein